MFGARLVVVVVVVEALVRRNRFGCRVVDETRSGFACEGSVSVEESLNAGAKPDVFASASGAGPAAIAAKSIEGPSGIIP